MLHRIHIKDGAGADQPLTNMDPNQKKARDKSPAARAAPAGGAAGAPLAVDDDDEEVEPVETTGTTFTAWEFWPLLAMVVSFVCLFLQHGSGVTFSVMLYMLNLGVVLHAFNCKEKEKTTFLMLVHLASIFLFTMAALSAAVTDCSTCWGPGTVSAQSIDNYMKHCAKLQFLAKKFFKGKSDIFWSMLHDQKAEKTWPMCFDDYDGSWNPCAIEVEAVMSAYTKQQLSCRTK